MALNDNNIVSLSEKIGRIDERSETTSENVKMLVDMMPTLVSRISSVEGELGLIKKCAAAVGSVMVGVFTWFFSRH